MTGRPAPDTVRRPHEWAARALCRTPNADPTWWEDDRPFTVPGRTAIAWCSRCPVIEACLAYAMKVEGSAAVEHRHGIYGGLTATQRAALYRGRDAAGRQGVAA